jgi:phosphohistidine phosphatase
MDLENKCQLIIMRHAKSDWASGNESDFDRPLAKRGSKDANRMGSWLAEQDLSPDIIIASPSGLNKQH